MASGKTAIGIIVAFIFIAKIVGVGFEVQTFGLNYAGEFAAKYVVVGNYDLSESTTISKGGDSIEIATLGGKLGLITTFLVVWLIIFVTFGDIIDVF